MSYRQDHSGPARARLIVIQQGRERGREIRLAYPGSYLVGRGTECDIVLSDRQVTRRHAHFYWRGLQLMVEGLGTGPGIEVNGVAVIEPQALREGDRVHIGRSTVVVEALPMLSPGRLGAPSTPYYPAPPVPKAGRGRGWWTKMIGMMLAAVIVLGGLGMVVLWYFNQQQVTDQPVVSVHAPASGSQTVVGSPVIVQATAIDDTGIIRMELWVDGVMVDERSSLSPQGQSPFLADFSWTPQDKGSHTLAVRAYNMQNLASTPISVAVESTMPTVTPTPLPTGTPTPLPTATQTSPPTSTFTPLPTLTPTFTPTPVAEIMAMLVVNVRSGPSSIYPVIGQLGIGDTAQVLGRNDSQSWWQIVYPPDSDGVGWVASLLVQGNDEALAAPIVTPPPPPERTATPEP